jgi:HK97 family phage major capsid protein
MKHNFSAWRYLDASPESKGGGSEAIVKSIEDLGKKHLEQVKALETSQKQALEETKKQLEEDVQKAKAEAQKALAEVEELKKKSTTPGFGGGQQYKSFEQIVEENITANKDKLPLSVKGKFAFEMNFKTVGNLGSAANLTGSYFVPPTTVPGVILQPYNDVHMRNLLPTGSTNSNVIRHIRDNGGEGGPAMVAEGGTKPQMDRDLAVVDANVRKVATYLRVPEEMIEDIPFLTSFLTNVGTEEVLAIEDTQILYGDGTGQNLSGLANAGNFTAFAAGTSIIGASANQFDVLRAAQKQMRTLKRTPSFALVSPTDYFDMVSKKDTTNNYILSGGGNGLVPSLDGVPIYQLNQIAAGDFIVMDRNSTQIFFRANITTRFYEQDQDNAIKNMVTIVIEERLALPIYYVNGIIKGTFTAGITDLTS